MLIAKNLFSGLYVFGSRLSDLPVVTDKEITLDDWKMHLFLYLLPPPSRSVTIFIKERDLGLAFKIKGKGR